MNKNFKTRVTLAVLFTLNIKQHTSASDFNNPDERQWKGVKLRAGIGTVADRQQCELDQIENYRRTLHKLIAEEATQKAEIAKFVLAFKHNFIVPNHLRNALPEEVTSKILDLNTYGAKFTLDGKLEDKINLASALLRVNGLGEDIIAATDNPKSRFVRLINETQFDATPSPINIGKSFISLAMHLGDHGELGLSETEGHNIISALFHSAAHQFLSTLLTEHDKSEEDLFISAAQLKLWAAHHNSNPQMKITYIVDSLALFSKATDISNPYDQDLQMKIKSHQHLAYDYFKQILLDQGYTFDPVHQFIESQRQKL